MDIVDNEKVKSFEPISDTEGLLQNWMHKYLIRILFRLTQYCEHPDEEVDLYYEQLYPTVKLVNKSDGEFNAKIGRRYSEHGDFFVGGCCSFSWDEYDFFCYTIFVNVNPSKIQK